MQKNILDELNVYYKKLIFVLECKVIIQPFLLILGVFMKFFILLAMATLCLFTFLGAENLNQADKSWLVDMEQAKIDAAKDQKSILVVFSGSDWCVACIKLHKLVLTKTEFLEKAKKEFVLVNVDFPSKKQNALSTEQLKKNNALAEQYNPDGLFPLVMIIDQNGKVVKIVEKYHGESPAEYFYKTTSSKGTK